MRRGRINLTFGRQARAPWCCPGSLTPSGNSRQALQRSALGLLVVSHTSAPWPSWKLGRRPWHACTWPAASTSGARCRVSTQHPQRAKLAANAYVYQLLQRTHRRPKRTRSLQIVASFKPGVNHRISRATAHTAISLTAACRAADLARTCYAAGCTVEQVRGCVRHLIVCVPGPPGPFQDAG